MSFEPGQELKQIISDNKSGSAELLENLNIFLTKNIKNYNSAELISFLKINFSEFSNIQNYLNELENIIKDKSKKINSFFNDFTNIKNKTIRNIFKNSFNELKDFRNFITISNSRTISNYFEVFCKDNNSLSITVCESRPVLEGRILADELQKLGIDVKLITEAMIANEIVNIEAAIIGADSILPNGNVVNKIGSKLLAVVCKYYKKPFYVLTDKSKISKSNKFIQVKKPVSEIWDSSQTDIKIDNYYFEEVDKGLITKIFTD